MKPSQNIPNGSTMDEANNAPESKPEMTPEQELVFRLKTAIDSRGRYSYRLNDMAAGYAAGKGTSTLAARREIEAEFARQTGQTPQQYLDSHYAELKQSRPPQGRSM